MNSAAEIEQTAAEWLVRREGEGWSDADQAAFNEWIAEETAHRIAVIRLETAWSKAGRLRASALRDGDDAPAEQIVEDEYEPETEVPPTRRRWLWPTALAASLALVSVPAYQAFFGTESYATAVGGFQSLPLADGSRVDLNTNSRIEVAYSEAERQLELEQGEAFFNVAKNPDRPFVVHAGPYRVTAVGTAFTVELSDGDINVVVTEGRVRIDAPSADGEPARPIFASAGEAAFATGATPVVRPLDAAAMDMALSWRDGLLIFESKPLGEVAAELNRYNQVKLVVDPSATGVVVDGSFRATNLDGFLRLLEQGFGVESVRDGENELVLKKI